MAEFSTIGNRDSIPYADKPLSDNPLQLTNPDSILSGTNRGTQFIGSANLQIDSAKQLITINDANANNVLSFGKISPLQLGLSLKNVTGTALFVGQSPDGSVGLNTVDASGKSILFAGKDATGNAVVKIAKAGFDAKTATNDQLIFNSGQNVLKIVSILTISVSASGGNQYNSSSVAHGLGYTPALLAYIQVPSNLSGNNPSINHANPALIYGTVAGVFRTFALAEVVVDGSNIGFSVQTDNSVGGGSYTWNAKVYLLQETFA